jgi:hypothetical protein
LFSFFNLDFLLSSDSQEEDSFLFENDLRVIQNELMAQGIAIPSSELAEEELKIEALLAAGPVETADAAKFQDFVKTSQFPTLLNSMCGGTQAFIARLKEANVFKKNACSVVWKKGDWIYHCKDCERDRQCAFCVDCFDESLHVGHNYTIGRAAGGICDCGDVNAWNPDTFCNNHRLREFSDFEKSFFQTPSFALGLDTLVRHLGEAIDEIVKNHSFSPGTPVPNMIRFLSLLPELFGDCVGGIVLEDLKKYNVLLKLCQYDATELSFCQKMTHKMIFSYLGDFSFKMEFSRCYAKVYGSILGLEKKRSLTEFSVQVLTNELVAEELVREEPEFLCGLLKFVSQKIRSSRDVDPLTKKVSCNGELVHFGRGDMVRATHDLRYLFGHPAVVLVILTSEQYWELLVDVLDAMQGSVWLLRKMGEHVLYEPKGYRNVLGFEGTFMDHVSLIEKASFLFTAETYRTAIGIVWKKLEVWLAANEIDGDYIDTVHPITVSMPLLRVMGMLLRCACAQQKIPLLEVAPFLADEKNLFKMSAHIARICRFCATQEGGLWRRNGEPAHVVAWFYTSPVDMDSCMIDFDYFLLRCFLEVAPNMPRFLMKFCNQFLGADDEHLLKEALLRCLICLATDHYDQGTEEERMKRAIVHALASCEHGKSTHSKLLQQLPENYTSHLKFDAYLEDVATFSGSLFTLKVGKFWKTISPYYYKHYLLEQRQTAEEVCFSEFKKTPAGKEATVFSAGPLACSAAAFGFSGVSKMLHCSELWEICLSLVTEHTATAEAAKKFSAALLRCFDFLNCAARSESADAFVEWVGEADLLSILLKIGDKVITKYCKTGLDRLLAALATHPVLADRLKEYGDVGKGEEQKVEETMAERRARMKLAAKERQRKIEEKMKAERDKFAAKNASALTPKKGPKRGGSLHEEEEEVAFFLFFSFFFSS